ncbi:MAG: class II aldolase/adducin family protein, partial [Nitrososphaerota archaeon]|nr:class II aldolase/adducin family protein [Nitrososphaerota archaeon]
GVKSLEELVVMDLDLRKISGKWEKMNESIVHAAIYKARPEVNGVTYVHPFYADLFAAMNKPIPAYGENLPIYDSKGAIADESRAQGLMKALGDKDAVLTRNPCSLITTGDSVKNATVTATRIEGIARRDYNSLLLNRDSYLKDAPKLNPKYPPKNFAYHVDEFNMDVLHNDGWAQLYEKYIVNNEGPKRNEDVVGSTL